MLRCRWVWTFQENLILLNSIYTFEVIIIFNLGYCYLWFFEVFIWFFEVLEFRLKWIYEQICQYNYETHLLKNSLTDTIHSLHSCGNIPYWSLDGGLPEEPNNRILSYIRSYSDKLMKLFVWQAISDSVDILFRSYITCIVQIWAISLVDVCRPMKVSRFAFCSAPCIWLSQALEKMKRDVTVETSGEANRKQLNDVTNRTGKGGVGNSKTSQSLKKSVIMVRLIAKLCLEQSFDAFSILCKYFATVHFNLHLA